MTQITIEKAKLEQWLNAIDMFAGEDRQKALYEASKEMLQALAAPVQEPKYWNVIDPAGNIVASETDAIRGWARIAGSYKPTVEGLLGFHDQGWRVLPKVTPPAAQPAVPLTDEQIGSLLPDDDTPMSLGEAFVKFARLVEAAHGIKENT